MVMQELPSWAEWQALDQGQKEYHEHLWKQGVNIRLDRLETKKQSKFLTAISAFFGGVVAVWCVVWVKGSSLTGKVIEIFK